MSTTRFSVDSRFVWKGVPYRVKRLLPDNLMELENLLNGEVESVAFTDMFSELVNDYLSFPSSQTTKQPKQSATPTLDDFTLAEQETAKYRLDVIMPLLKLPASERTRERINGRVKEIVAAQQRGELPKKSVSVASIYRWMKAYTEHGNDIRALLRKRKATAVDESESEKILQQVIQERYFKRERVNIDDIVHEITSRVDIENRLRSDDEKLPIPSRTTVWRRIEAIDVERKLTAKKGKRAAKQELSQPNQMEYPKFPLERVEIDHTLTDLFVVDDDDNLPLGRLTLTYCLDVATRYPLGFYLGFEPPSYLTVSACLHHAILPKGDAKTTYGMEHEWLACGIPNMLVVDNGKEFIGASLQDACLSLGITLQQLPIKTPEFKATVERMFSTLNTGLFHMLPGTTFSNFGMKGDYDSLRYASLKREEVNQLMHLFLIDIYAQRFHRGLGAVPARRWEDAMEKAFFPRVPTSAEDLSILLARTTERNVNHYGIEFESLRYNCDELALLRHRLAGSAARTVNPSGKVKLKYMPSDLSHIFVFDPFTRTYIKVPALDQVYTNGLTLWSHTIIRHEALANRDRVNIRSLVAAKKKIQEIVEQSKQRGKVQSRKKMARWEASNEIKKSNGNKEANLPSWLHSEHLRETEVEGWSLETLK